MLNYRALTTKLNYRALTTELNYRTLTTEPNSGIRAILIRVRTYAIKSIVACFSIMLGFIDPDIY